VTEDRPPHSTATEEPPPPPAPEESPATAPDESAQPEPAPEPPPPPSEPPSEPPPSEPPPSEPPPSEPPPAAEVPATDPETGLPVNVNPDGPGPKIIGFEPIPPPAPPAPPKPRPKRPPRPRDPLPWPELRSAATAVTEDATPDELKDIFRLLPEDVREETIDGVREYRKGARRPVSAYAGKSLARAVHTARRARRNPESDDAVSEAIGQALAAEAIASLDVEVAAEVILPKRDLLDREAKTARRRQKAEDDRERDERRRRAREASGQQGGTFGSFSGTKIRGLDEVAKLLQEQETSSD
jgi:hypothetical protein